MIKRLSLFFLFLGLLFVATLCIKSSHYSYDTSKPYLYHFHHEPQSVPLTVDHHEITIPRDLGTEKTTFLTLDIDSSLTGKCIEPYLEIVHGTHKSTAYFERGAQGKRYINISAMHLKKGDHLQLIPHALHIGSQAEMVRFENPTIGKKHVLVIAPHPDDAEIAAFAFYSAHHENAYVLTVTAGDFGPPNNYRFLEPDPQKAYLLKAKLRIFNSITTPLVGGVPPQRCLNLGYFDGTLYDMFKNPQKTFTSKGTGIADRNIYTSQNLNLLTASLTHQANWHNLVKDIRTVLEEIKPDIIVTPSPFIDAHPDHQFSTIALLEALGKTDLKKGKLLLYTNHLILSESFPYGPRGATYPLPPNFDATPLYDGVYSYNLTHREQQIKVLALDTMNDLRNNTHMRDDFYLIKTALKRFLKVELLGLNDASYFRRAVRENELFFTLDYNKADHFKRVFLQSHSHPL